QIGQILVPVSDVERSVAFYEQVLGLPLTMRFPGIAFFDAAGVRLYLATVPQSDFQGRATIYFRVADVSATLELLESRGAPVRERPGIAHRAEDHDLWLAFVTDPDGNQIGLMREAPKGVQRG
ncbi:MAG TPA: VOC family protein, partial [Candidatus Limnocylindrales bacterium]|nr:VOC family protein [Candidatus Limnocylindrales bacterium]